MELSTEQRDFYDLIYLFLTKRQVCGCGGTMGRTIERNFARILVDPLALASCVKCTAFLPGRLQAARESAMASEWSASLEDLAKK